MSARWLTLPDPVDAGWSWRIDVPFLLSNWTCIWGSGCKGIHSVPSHGCCSVGAVFHDEDDIARVTRAAARLTPSDHQFHGRPWLHRPGRDPGTARTRRVDSGCVFLNRDGFAGGVGCALHIAALRRGEDPVDWKPQTCWQVPLFVDVDPSEQVRTLRRMEHRDWSPDSDERPLDWWCTRSPDALRGTEPVYRTLETELRRTLGDTLYEQVVDGLERTQRRRLPVV